MPQYQIPYQRLLAKDGQNLLTAGRCMSTEQLVLSSARVTTTCSMMGQAASIGLELAVERDWYIWLIHASSEFRCMVEVQAAPMGSIIVYMTIEKTTRLLAECRIPVEFGSGSTH